MVVSGIDTTEAVTEAAKFAAQGKKVWAVPYDYSSAYQTAPEVNLGVPYFNWGPAYATAVKAAMAGKWQSHFEWNAPDWKNINDPDTSAVGFNKGKALSRTASAAVDKFVRELPGGLRLWKGPLALQDGTSYLDAGHGGDRPADLVPAPAPAGHAGTERLEVSRVFTIRTFGGETRARLAPRF